MWDEADAEFSSRIAYVEVSAPLASAFRVQRTDSKQHQAALLMLVELCEEIAVVEVDETRSKRSPVTECSLPRGVTMA